jgi:hypothetical protein
MTWLLIAALVIAGLAAGAFFAICEAATRRGPGAEED